MSPQALVEAQQQFRGYIPDFTFNLGFCGQYYCKGTGESVGDSAIRGCEFCWRWGSEFVGVSTGGNGIFDLVQCVNNKKGRERGYSAIAGQQIGLWEEVGVM